MPAVYAVFSDPEVMRYWSFSPFTDYAAAAALVQSIGEMFLSRALFQWGVARHEDDLVIGTCTLLHLDPVHRRAEIGFASGRDYWGRGLMSEAVRTLIGFAFGSLGLHRLEADVDPRNAPSIRLLERGGFQREGLLRERYLVGGATQDSLLYGLLESEWLNQAGSPPRGRSGEEKEHSHAVEVTRNRDPQRLRR